MSEITPPPTLVRAQGLSKTFGEGALATPVLFDISLEIRAGEFCLLMGPSGSGKTTLLSILAGLLRSSTGQVELCGVPISEMPPEAATRIRREQVGFVFQAYNLFPALTALDNVAEVLRLKGVPWPEAQSRAQAALEGVGLGERLHFLPGNLSGGQKQRVALARALAGNPSLLIGDEPTAALDTVTGKEMMYLIRQQVDATRGVLIVTHDHRLERFATRVIEIEDGRIIQDRAPAGREVAR